jgi:hypothetical protein
MEIAETVQQSVSSTNIMQLLHSGLDDPECIKETCANSDLSRKIAELVETTRDLMNEMPMRSSVHIFGTESAMFQYTNSAGISLYIFPRLADPSKDSSEIRAFISDGFSAIVNENHEKLYLYICDNFSANEQIEILQSLLEWYRANFLFVESSICGLIRDFCRNMETEISRIITG